MPKDMKATDALGISIGQYSSTGRKPQNQDFHGALIPTGPALALKGVTLAVADGISSSAVSAEASEIAVKSLLTDYYATSDAWTVKTSALQVIAATNAWLHGQNSTVSDINAGRVCTLSTLILKGREGHILHVGDSRVQRLSGTSLEPLTDDHRMTVSPEQTFLARALGAGPEVKVDYRRVPLSKGDIFLLTTDGVHDVIEGSDVNSILQEAADLDSAAKKIADLAFNRASDDNLTVQILRVDQLPAPGVNLQMEATQLPIPPLPGAGDIIDGFRIVRSLHATARSHVYLAIAPSGMRVALKIPATETAQDGSYLNRFMLEEWIARRLSSPHVLSAAKVPEHRSALYVVTEYVEGATLRQWMTDNPKPSLDQVRGIITQIATGLRAFHRREMIHQDIRPENIMIDNDGTVKIIDLGSASVAGVEEAAPGTLGAMPGTYQYTAPEYLSGDAISWRSDQYALGVIAYEMLTGRLPYGTQVARIRSRRDQMALHYQAARDEYTGVPDWMDTALHKMLHPDPIKRYDALTECVADLKRPSNSWISAHQRPLMERNPLRFWQGLCAILALLCITLAAR
ncbi:serine/threonine protein kinase [Yoonia maritima]|uniref:Serine/threonine protein kinase n=1 Tax=Yoonia maritima TaxID=1435347 RepID=A0A2T0VZK3_9RHOB|nr:bifunctional protein-serine/threonine kinase/phosphatase [Yoonia maritima]PRY77763.1 serine/threonine protein kinase [Yoonia maritima]